MRFVLGIVASASLFGCAIDPSEGTTTQATTVHNKLAGNKLAGNKLAGNKLAGNKLAGNKLAGNKLQLNPNGAQDLLATQDGRDVLAYAVSCALPEGVVLEAPVPPGTVATADAPYSCANGVCDFFGEVGLVPHWLDRPLDRKGKGWISACLFSRVNAHDTSEAISLRGRNRALTVSADEEALYTVEEGAFYGNWFTPDDDPIDWNACEGEGQASGEFGGLVDRDCAEPDPTNPAVTQCGFTYAGFCRDFTPQFPSPFACKRLAAEPDHGSFYEECFSSSVFGLPHHHHQDHDGDHRNHDDDDDDGFRQVITTYVTP